LQGLRVQKATLAERLPGRSADYLVELKWDGYRMLATKHGARVCMLSRNLQDWSHEFRTLLPAVEKLAPKELVLDGEVCALDERGMPSFQLLQNSASAPRLVYVVFDILWCDGDDLTALALEDRRRRLEIVLKRGATSRLVLSPLLSGPPDELLAEVCARGLEGIVAKRRTSSYVGRRTSAWLKLKCRRRQELAIIGFMPLKGNRDAVGSLLVATASQNGYVYAGRVGTGFDERTRTRLGRLLTKDETPRARAKHVPRLGGVARFVEPRHVAEVDFSEWTRDGLVRQASFVGLRRDKAPQDCVREATRFSS
jgi:bifunctional non-homologous end joining protein LigD